MSRRSLPQSRPAGRGRHRSERVIRPPARRSTTTSTGVSRTYRMDQGVWSWSTRS